MKAPRLSQEVLHAIFQNVIGLRLDRTALWAGIEAWDPNGSVPLEPSVDTADNYAAQLLIDLNVLNKTPPLPGGVDPLRRWLSNAALLAKPRTQWEYLERCEQLLTVAHDEGREHADKQLGNEGLPSTQRPVVNFRMVATFSVAGATIGITLQFVQGSHLLVISALLVLVALILGWGVKGLVVNVKALVSASAGKASAIAIPAAGKAAGATTTQLTATSLLGALSASAPATGTVLLTVALSSGAVIASNEVTAAVAEQPATWQSTVGIRPKPINSTFTAHSRKTSMKKADQVLLLPHQGHRQPKPMHRHRPAPLPPSQNLRVHKPPRAATLIGNRRPPLLPIPPLER